MKKNAFTLIELIATIGLLGILATITITISVRKINETKESARDTMFESIELAAKNYITDYGNELEQFRNNDNIYISLQTLVEKEYFTESLVDPTTKKSIPLTNEVYVTKEENGMINASYDINQKQNPKLTLIGSYNEYVKLGGNYNELGVVALNTNKQDISSNVTITGNVNTSSEGTYKVTYEINEKKITRNVIVYSKNMSSEEILKASTYIERLYKTNNYQNDELKQTYATVNNEQVDAGIRYVGSNPNNYVYFNCEDEYTSDSKIIKYGDEDYVYKDHCEVWRIIGVFNTKSSVSDTTGTPRIKIVRDAFTINMSWDSSSNNGGTDNNSGYGINEWSQADIKNMLNGYYIGESSTCTYCGSSNQGTCSNDCSSSVTPLSDTSLNMIDNALWYTGTSVFESTFPLSTIYAGERSTQDGKLLCTTTNGTNYEKCNDNVTRTTTWEGKIGLIYTSDYAYASTNESCASDIVGSNSYCNENNWLHPSSGSYWTITPVAYSSYAYRVWHVSSSSQMYGDSAYYAYGVRPALYLSSSVKIKGGNGSSNAQYILSQ